jgi:hypothetical protein
MDLDITDFRYNEQNLAEYNYEFLEMSSRHKKVLKSEKYLK